MVKIDFGKDGNKLQVSHNKHVASLLSLGPTIEIMVQRLSIMLNHSVPLRYTQVLEGVPVLDDRSKYKSFEKANYCINQPLYGKSFGQ